MVKASNDVEMLLAFALLSVYSTAIRSTLDPKSLTAVHTSVSSAGNSCDGHMKQHTDALERQVWHECQENGDLEWESNSALLSLQEKVRTIFEDASFMPLPVRLVHDDEYGAYVWKSWRSIADVIIFDCDLTPFVKRNGAASACIVPKVPS